jgi:hypothetical protein
MNIVHLLLTPYFNFSLYLLGKKRKSDGEHAKGFKVKNTPPPSPLSYLIHYGNSGEN